MNISKKYSSPLILKRSSSSPGVHHARYNRMLPGSGPGRIVFLQKRCGVTRTLLLYDCACCGTSVVRRHRLFPDHNAFH